MAWLTKIKSIRGKLAFFVLFALSYRLLASQSFELSDEIAQVSKEIDEVLKKQMSLALHAQVLFSEIKTKKKELATCLKDHAQCQKALVKKQEQQDVLKRQLIACQRHLCKPHFQPRVMGETVTRAAIEFVRHVSLAAKLADISLFLFRIAKIESCLGEDADTYRPGYFGGIWQIDAIGFFDSKNVKSHTSLSGLIAVANQYLTQELGVLISYEDCSWESCLMPAYSCLAARLFLATVAEAVPLSLEDQASYWKKYYNRPKGKGTIARFLHEAV